MAGHSKFKNIMFRKGAQDKKRSKLFSKLSKEITIAVKLGGPDPDANPRLRLAIRNARGESMPKDNISRAIDKGAGSGGADYEDIRYEGFGPGGTGIIIEVSTDNRNRAASEVRTAFSKNGGNLGETGSVSFGFDQVGEIVFPISIGDEEILMDAAIEAGAEDVESDEESHVIYTAREDLMDVAGTLEAQFGEPQTTRLIWKPQNLIEVTGDDVGKVMRLVDILDDLDDVQNVYGNYDMSLEDMEAAVEE